MNARATSKAALLSESASFAAAATRVQSERGRLISGIGPGAEEGATPPRTGRLADLALNPENPRETLTGIQEMADSLLENGQLQVATVITRAAFLAKHPGREDDLGEARWVVLDGNRRLAGARQAGLDELRIDVRDDLADDLLTNAFVANIQHESFSPLEEARGLAKLVEEHGGLRAVARRISKSHVWVSQRLALLQLTPELQAAVESGELPVEDARQIGRLDQDQQAAAAERAAAARQAHKAQRAAGRRAGREAAGAGGGGDGGPGDQATPPPGPAPPAPEGPGNGAPPAVPGGASGPDGTDGPTAGGNGVTTPPAALGPASRPGGPAARADDDSPAVKSAPPPAVPGGASGPDGTDGPTAGGNGVTTPPAPDAGDVIDWADLWSLATLIRRQLTASQLHDLLGLLAEDS